MDYKFLKYWVNSYISVSDFFLFKVISSAGLIENVTLRHIFLVMINKKDKAFDLAL